VERTGARHWSHCEGDERSRYAANARHARALVRRAVARLVRLLLVLRVALIALWIRLLPVGGLLSRVGRHASLATTADQECRKHGEAEEEGSWGR
jgi:hypothetical protein